MVKRADPIATIILMIVLIIAFPAIGAVLLNSILTGFLIGLVIALVIGFLWFLWFLHNEGYIG